MIVSVQIRGSHKWEAIPVKRSLGGSWKQICQADKDGYEGNSRMMEMLQIQVGRGDKTLFWLDKWVSEHPQKELFPGLFALEKQKDVLLAESYEYVANVMNWKWRWNRKPELQFDLQNYVRLISSVMVSSNPDCWLWKELNGKCSTYSVKSLRWELDNSGQQVQKSNSWLKWLPININCFIWRLLLDRIATKCALNTRGINVGELGCAVCDTEPETTQHLFMHCKGIKSIWAIIFDWVKLPQRVDFESIEEIMDYPSKIIRCKEKCWAVQSILATTCWMIWLSRNGVVFYNAPLSMSKMVFEIKSASFLWVKQRSIRISLDWEKWCQFNFINFPL
ncbi:uncharacterized protein LOC143625011 [Bidens hawaiensis]|uniref:uncharacterized protein LOC143625011 n=1 Tax=Bidens hawaiensis TaxID=980011 RepID=UPI00404AFBA5